MRPNHPFPSVACGLDCHRTQQPSALQKAPLSCFALSISDGRAVLAFAVSLASLHSRNFFCCLRSPHFVVEVGRLQQNAFANLMFICSSAPLRLCVLTASSVGMALQACLHVSCSAILFQSNVGRHTRGSWRRTSHAGSLAAAEHAWMLLLLQCPTSIAMPRHACFAPLSYLVAHQFALLPYRVCRRVCRRQKSNTHHVAPSAVRSDV